ncbi:hypothetical protein Nepgr_016182 [Nepenthes gracilis]|uniref:Uncharacterized protein n=1 Tax=Nepenthes gracilis TaxID=150966 RepID=A0AAD3XS13_NEPGR|nr:hypothetical protein Nepgr_016182 [Nepenthes gracilis]
MGRSVHSSKRKSSSSSLKRKKHSQDRGRKKSRSDKDKSKRPYSFSCSVDDSASNSSGLDSKLDYRRRSKRRGRSQARRDARGRKRSADKSLSSSKSGEDTTKQKRSKKSGVSDATRKEHRGKKRRRERSVNSLSCSTYESSDGREGECERMKVKLEKKERYKKGPGKNRSERTRYRSRSCCSCSSSSEEREINANYPRRLRSVVAATAVQEETNGNESNRDAIKDDIVSVHDDYQSCKSSEGDDGIPRREALNCSLSEKTRSLVDLNREDVASNVRLSRFSGSAEPAGGKHDGNPASYRGGQSIGHSKENKSDVAVTRILECRELSSGEHDGNPSTFGGPHISGTSKENGHDVSTANGVSNADDLEAILRQKALENLRKFREEARANMKILGHRRVTHDGDVNQLSVRRTDRSSQYKPDKEVGHGLASAISKGDHVIMAAVGKGNTHSIYKEDRGSEAEFRTAASRPAKEDIFRPLNRKQFDFRHSSEKLATANLSERNDRRNVSTSQLDNQLLGANKNPRGVPVSAVVPAAANESLGASKTLKQAPDLAASRKAAMHDTVDPLSKKQFDIHPSSEELIISNHSEQENATCGSFNDKSDLKKECYGTNEPLEKVVPAVPEPPLQVSTCQERHLKYPAEGSQSVPQNNNVVTEGVDRNASSEPSSSNDKPKEGDEGSQFQQKTMSVMRGGELVQVSYKVYIPKKAPALARRQLKR